MDTRRHIQKYKNNKAQATTELAIMGAIIILLLAHMVSQGYLTNQRIGLEMYTFRKALELSRNQKRGIMLRVIRDVVAPSFFTRLNRERITAVASIDYNPWILYIPYEDDPEHVPILQLIQINDAMIRNNYFLKVPPTKVKLNDEDPMWQSSAILDIVDLSKENQYREFTNITKKPRDIINPPSVAIVKNLTSTESSGMKIVFKTPEEIKKETIEEDWENKIKRVEISEVPKDLEVYLYEELNRSKETLTYYEKD